MAILAIKDTKLIQLDNYTFPYWSHILGEIITTSTLAGTIIWAVWLVVDALFINKKVVKFRERNFNFQLFV